MYIKKLVLISNDNSHTNKTVVINYSIKLPLPQQFIPIIKLSIS